MCRSAGVLLVVNASQAIGARPIDVGRSPVDAVVSCGYKWLCGPYGTTRQTHQQLHDAGIDAAFREGNLRLSLHLFNTAEDVSRALQALHDTTASRS